MPPAESEWQNETTGLPATREDLTCVPGDLQPLLIRGDFTGGFQFGGLDNVVLTPEPAGPVAALITLA